MDAIRKTLPIIGLLVTAAGVALIAINFTLGTGFAAQLQSNKLMLVALVTGALGAVLTLVGFTVTGVGPNFKYYLAFALTSLFAVASLIVVYLIVKNHSVDYDVTEVRMHSLHPRTVAFLRGLERDVRLTAFPSPDDRRAVEKILERYSRVSPRVTYAVRDPHKDVKIARSVAENIAIGDVFIETGTRGADGATTSTDYRQKRISASGTTNLNEPVLTNAIVEVVRPEAVKVCFLAGHGETGFQRAGPSMFGAPPEATGPSYATAREILTDEMSFKAEELELARTGFIPEDCSLLVAAGPQSDLLAMEADAIRDYLAGGGRALILLDPNERPRARFDEWERLLADFGVAVKHDMVFERNPLSQLTDDYSMLLVSRFGAHPIVERGPGVLQMSRVRTVTAREGAPTTATATPLLYSSNMSWAEDIEALRALMRANQALSTPTPDRLKEQSLGVAVTVQSSGGPDKGARLVVLGDSEIFEDRFLPNTAWLYANAVNWLVAREDLIDIPTKRLPDTPIFPSTAQLRAVFTLLVIGFPSVVFFGGLGYVLVRRRLR